MRVLHCPASVGGHALGLARAERTVGLSSHSVIFRPSPFGYTADETLYRQGESPLVFELRRWKLLLRAISEFDVVHFNFGRSILPSLESLEGVRGLGNGAWVQAAYASYARMLEFRDLPLLKRLGKTIAVTFQGDDARQGDFCRSHFEIQAATEVEDGYYSPEKDQRRREVIQRFGRYADLIYALNPDLLHVLPPQARFVPYAHIDLSAWSEVPVPRNEVPVIGHAPTHEGVKGTEHIRRAIEKLRSNGYRFEFRVLKGFSHDEMREQLGACDLLVDQLLIGWYGGLAVEAMALGCPVICYLRKDDLSAIPRAMADDLPILDADPTSIASVIQSFLESPAAQVAELRSRSRRFVESWHDPLRIARDTLEDYRAAAKR